MDINSLLSPSESPASPARRPSLRRQLHSSDKTTSTNTTPPHSVQGSYRREAANSISPRETPSEQFPARLHPSRTPTATAGIDTLADVASLQQQHSSKTRTRVAAEIIKPQNPLPSSYAALSTWSSGAEGSDARNTPTRVFRSVSLAGEEQAEVVKLVAEISANGFNYQAHAKLIELLHKGFVAHIETEGATAQTFDLIDDLRRARKAMDDRFPVGENLWVDWIADEALLARDLKEKVEVLELCKRAIDEEVSSTRLWKIYGGWVQTLYEGARGGESAGWSAEEQELAQELFTWDSLVDVWRQAASATKWQLNDSNVIWDRYAELLTEDLAASPSAQKVVSLRDSYLTRLKTPHATWEDTFSQFSSFITKFDNDNYEQIMVDVSKLTAEARTKYADREMYELKVVRASNDDELWHAYAEYLQFETSHERRTLDTVLCAALFERALLKFGVEASLWEDYVFFVLDKAALGPQSIPILPILKRATRHCPWSGDLWSQYLLSAEKGFKPFNEIETIKHHATQGGLIDIGGLQEVLKALSTWCGFLRRRARAADSNDEELDVAEFGIRSAIESSNELGKKYYGEDYHGDPLMRLERIYIGFLSSLGNWDQARMVWKTMLRTRGNEYTFWFRFYRWEMYCWGRTSQGVMNRDATAETRPAPPTQATAVLEQAVRNENLDWPDKIFETFQNHVEDYEDIEVVQAAMVLLRKRQKECAQRRGAAAAAQHAHAVPAAEESPALGKRKRDSDEQAGEATQKRSRMQSADLDVMDTSGAATEAGVKRDRENSTVIVRRLPADVTEVKIERFFRDCGTIKSVVIVPEGETATATIEFESPEDVPTAQTKDMKKFEGHVIQVESGLACTLWVTNFPATADQAYLRELFSQHGDVVEVRLPSLKFNTKRRFCYIQMKSPEQAQAALALNGKDLGQKGTLIVKLSNPAQKENRTGAIYDGREVYVSNVDWAATQDDLKDIFSQYGKIENVRLPKNLSGKSKGMAFVVFSNKDEAEASLELNATKFKSRILTVQMSEADHAKRPGLTSGHIRSVSPSVNGVSEQNGQSESAETPSASTIRSKTFAVIGLPDTFNAARLTEICSKYGKLVKVQLRPDHGGAIIEYEQVGDAGKAELALDNMEVEAGRQIQVTSIPQLLKERGETKSSSLAEKKGGLIPAAARVSRPAQPGRGGRGGLGMKKRVVLGGNSVSTSDSHMEDGNASGGGKHNSDFKALYSASGKP